MIRVLLALPMLAMSQPSTPGKGDLSLRPLIGQDRLNGAVCSFWLEGGDEYRSDVFQWDSNEAWINITGQDVPVKLVKQRYLSVRPDAASIGDRQVLEFSGTDLRVTLRTRTTKVCAKLDTECEERSVAGELQVIARGWSRRAKVKGWCGS